MRALWLLVVMMLAAPSMALAQAHCEFYPDGQPICEPPNVNPLHVTCPLCPPQGMPRLNLDNQMLAVKEATKSLRETIIETQKLYNEIAQKSKDSICKDGGPETNFTSDEWLRGLSYPKLPPEDYANPDLDPNASVNDVVSQIARSQYTDAPTAPVDAQLRMRKKRTGIVQRQIIYGNAVAMQTKSVYENNQYNKAVSAQIQDLLAAQSKAAIERNTMCDLVAARGAILRAILAAQTRQMGLIATTLVTQSTNYYGGSEVPMARPEAISQKGADAEKTGQVIAPYYARAEAKVGVYQLYSPQQAQDSTRPEMRQLHAIQSQLFKANLDLNTYTSGVNFPADRKAPDPAVQELQALNYGQKTQQQPREMYLNTVNSRAIMIERLHNQRVLSKLQQNAAQHIDDTIACHGFATEQLDRVRRDIIPHLRYSGRSGGVMPAIPSTNSYGPYTQRETPLTSPYYPAQKTNLDRAFEAIAGRPPQNYQYHAASGSCPERFTPADPGLQGRMLQLDGTTYMGNILERHKSATGAACTVADQMMLGKGAKKPLLFPTDCVVRSFPNPMGPPTVIYCLGGTTRDALAPVNAMPGATSAGFMCRYNTGQQGGYYTADRPGPSLGLMGQWLEAYKIEQYWAQQRYGTPGKGCQMTTLGAEIYKKRAMNQIDGINQQYNAEIKGINDADGRFLAVAGADNIAATTIDLSTPDGRWQSMQVQLQQVAKIEADLREKEARLAQYDRDKAVVKVPADAPDKIKKQWQADLYNMEQVKSDIQNQIKELREFLKEAKDIVDDRQGTGDTRNNYCLIFHKPRLTKGDIKGSQIVTDKTTGLQYEASIFDDGYEMLRKKCVNLQPIKNDCKGITPPGDNKIYVTPGVRDE